MPIIPIFVLPARFLLDFCSLCGFCSLCAPDTHFSALCTALESVVFTAFTTSRFMSWVFRCHCACLYEAYIYLVFCLYDVMILQHHILCRFLEVGPCPPAQTVGSCPVNRAPKTSHCPSAFCNGAVLSQKFYNVAVLGSISSCCKQHKYGNQS